VVSLTGGHDKAVPTAHDGNPAGVELEKIECTAFRSSWASMVITIFYVITNFFIAGMACSYKDRGNLDAL
jgi:hypothetical protein